MAAGHRVRRGARGRPGDRRPDRLTPAVCMFSMPVSQRHGSRTVDHSSVPVPRRPASRSPLTHSPEITVEVLLS